MGAAVGVLGGLIWEIIKLTPFIMQRASAGEMTAAQTACWDGALDAASADQAVPLALRVLSAYVTDGHADDVQLKAAITVLARWSFEVGHLESETKGAMTLHNELADLVVSLRTPGAMAKIKALRSEDPNRAWQAGELNAELRTIIASVVEPGLWPTPEELGTSVLAASAEVGVSVADIKRMNDQHKLVGLCAERNPNEHLSKLQEFMRIVRLMMFAFLQDGAVPPRLMDDYQNSLEELQKGDSFPECPPCVEELTAPLRQIIGSVETVMGLTQWFLRVLAGQRIIENGATYTWSGWTDFIRRCAPAE